MRLKLFLTLLALAAGIVWVVGAAARPAHATTGGYTCSAHRPAHVHGVFYVHYTPDCSGHDEPELDPLSNAPGSARDLTWTAVLPTDRRTTVDAVGPAFWFGGTVDEPTSLFGQAFYELQFYPNGVVSECTPDGGYEIKYVKNAYTVCSPVWSVVQLPDGSFDEPAAFNAMLTDSQAKGKHEKPLVMHAGDTITVHAFQTKAKDGMHLTVNDLDTGRDGTIVLNSPVNGPLNPSYDKQQLGNALGWGIVYDTPNSFVWEIGHTSNFADPPGDFCLPGDPVCDSYNADSWAGFSPIVIRSVTFGRGPDNSRGNGSQETAKHWAVVSDYGGRDEINQNCGAANYGNPFCIYPWFTLGRDGFRYGVNYRGTIDDFGKVDQFQETTNCGGPFGPDSTYCATVVK